MRDHLTGTVLALAAALALAAGPAAAQSEDESILRQDSTPSSGTTLPPPEEEREELPTTYSNIGLQRVTTDFDNVDDAVNLDITMIGFRVPTVPWFGIELNLGFTMIPGEVTEAQPAPQANCGGLLQPPCQTNTTESVDDFGVTTVGAFGVLRSQGKFFVMGKYGYRYLNTNLPELQENKSGNAWGTAVGYRWNKKGSFAEFGYTKYSEEIDALGFLLSYTYDRR